ncbi:AraC family transcriptional regulator [Paenibacillus sp. GCM10023248]|uniref:AraC family transcriptional regulator n=1 Tax=unclassified Paenibacillus TaxID=185978 RepID=UPI0023788010|nr:AraC family transcriptional regulator [Paenibacillus sp. MAHUQ-63]MDD9267315.1 AraC family transcriptional regulator [Paenibacillus sp. MAHUQ-63]
MSYMNIPYGLNQASVSQSSFLSIWKVQADNAYQVTKGAGFDFPGLFITYEGSGVFLQDNRQFDLQAGTYFFTQEAIPCSYRCLNNDWKFYFLDFSSLDIARELRLPADRVVSTVKITEATQLCERLIDTLIAEPVGYAYSANIFLQELLLLLAREQSAAPDSRYSELNQILIYIHRHIDQALRIEELIERSGMSRTAFFTRFRAVTGQPPGDYILNLKIESARVSLETTNFSVKEIAAQLQFYDEFHFSKLFKRKYGLSPSAYRDTRH